MLGSGSLMAQSMSDSQVLEYVKDGIRQGKEQKQLASEPVSYTHLIGVGVSAPLGPVGVLCIQRTLNKGRWYGFVTGLGASLSDIAYAPVSYTHPFVQL